MMQVIRDTTNTLYPIIAKEERHIGIHWLSFYELLLNCDVL